MTKTQYQILKSLAGLAITAIEKICVLGEQDAKSHIQQLKEVYEDLILFWGLDDSLLTKFDEKIEQWRNSQIIPC